MSSPRPARPLALGIHWAHDAAAAICSPEGILFSLQEERPTRIKHYYGFPCRSIESALAFCGLRAADIDLVAFSSQSVFYPEHPRVRVVRADGPAAPAPGRSGPARRLRSGVRAGLELLGIGGAVAARGKSAWERDGWREYAERHYSRMRPFLRDLGLLDPRIAHYYVAHHRAHAAAAFRLCGMPEATVVTADGKGDGLCGTIYRGQRDGTLALARSSPAADSLGSFYQAVTEALGFIPVDGEYKTMGLAARGRGIGENPFTGTVRVEDGVFRSRVAWTFRSFNARYPERTVPNPLGSVSQAEDYRRLLEDMAPEELAYRAQEHLEQGLLAYARDALRIAGLPALAGAGGVLLNVKANALLRDELAPAGFFVFPDAADSGLAAGAALEALFQEGALAGPLSLRTPYLGPAFGEEEIRREIERYRARHGLRVVSGTPETLAEKLCSGRVIGTFQDRMELGPRALGNRSVLADPRSGATRDRINGLLKGREDFVPFAPALLEEEAGRFWSGPTDLRYMTFLVEASAYARETVPAVVHVDGTMRPQVVSPASNPWLHELLLAFRRRAGVGVLLNTSFNRHGLPIVGRPEDALEHLVRGWVDGVSIGPWYVERDGETRP